MATRTFPWKPSHEALIVAIGAREALAQGKSRLEALQIGQRALPKSKRLPYEALVPRSHPSAKMLDHAIERLSRMTPEQIAALLPPKPGEIRQEGPYIPQGHTKLPPAEYGGKAPLKWSEVEWALITRRVDWWRSQGSTAGTPRLVIEAQEIELPPERRRPRGSLQVNVHTHMEPYLTQARQEWMPLVADMPLDPMARIWTDPATPEPQPNQFLPQPEPEPLEAAQPPAVPNPPPIPESTRLEPPGPVAEPAAPFALANARAQEAARVFATTLASALANALEPAVASMLATHEQLLIQRVREEQRLHGRQLAKDMSELLVDRMDRMLGGSGSAAPPEPSDPFPSERPSPPQRQEPPGQEQRKPRIKVDIVGFEEGRHNMMVKHKLNGHLDALDLRFVHPDDHTTYTPSSDRHVVLLTKRIPHTMQEKIKASGCKPVYVRHTVGNVVDAIENLLGRHCPT